MPKMKTKKIVTKRFKVTKRGKLLHRTQGMRHIRRNKSKSRQRRQDRGKQVTTRKYQRIIKQFLAI
ncbi:50S ribosomal protein L35 [Patescibacteria group bacterium]|nr:50S ribosomal protein L35 [Patescibacteria group bacterium]